VIQDRPFGLILEEPRHTQQNVMAPPTRRTPGGRAGARGIRREEATGARMFLSCVTFINRTAVKMILKSSHLLALLRTTDHTGTRYHFMQRIAQCLPSRHDHAAVVAAIVFVCNVIAAAAVHELATHASGTWSTAALSVARGALSATSLPNAGLAFFAGGHYSACFCCVCLS
jgi:hypothetical protein